MGGGGGGLCRLRENEKGKILSVKREALGDRWTSLSLRKTNKRTKKTPKTSLFMTELQKVRYKNVSTALSLSFVGRSQVAVVCFRGKSHLCYLFCVLKSEHVVLIKKADRM